MAKHQRTSGKRRGQRPATQFKRFNGGFTLVEVLLALSLMSMLLALAYGGLRASTRATEKGQVILEDSSQVRMAHQFVHQRLNQMLPLAYFESEDKTERPVFSGTSTSIRYVAPMPGYLGFGGPQVQELSFVPGEKGLDLVLSHALLQGFVEEQLYQSAPLLLMDNIESARFSFLGKDEAGEIIHHEGEWPEPNILPEAVILEVVLNESVYIHWPMLSAAPRIDSNSISLALKSIKIGDQSGATTGKINPRKPITRE